MSGAPNNGNNNVYGASPVYEVGTPKNITANANTQVKAGSGVFQRLTINTAGTTSTFTAYDGTDNTGTKIGTFTTTAQGSVAVNAYFATGLFVVTAGGAAADVTVVYL